MLLLRDKLISAIPSAEKAVLQARLESVKATIRERLRDGHHIKELSALARNLKKCISSLG
jgi:hypothetical protein